MIPLRFVSILPALLFMAPALFAVEDASPVDAPAILSELKQLRELQKTQSKVRLQTGLQAVQAAGASNEAATNAWEEAVRAVQFDGAPKENAAFRDWKEKEGAGLSGNVARNAARLYFIWLGLTIQRANGMEAKQLMPQVIAFTKELAADQLAYDALEASIRHDKELQATKRGMQHKNDDERVRAMHEIILKRPLASSPVVKYLRIGDFAKPEKWETTPGNLDGIFSQILLPVLREDKDPRVLEYWTLRLKKEGDAAAKSKLLFDQERFTNVRAPSLMWSRAEDMVLIGQTNRGISEMFSLVKAHPQHPEAENWIARLESLLAPPSASTTAPVAAAPASAN